MAHIVCKKLTLLPYITSTNYKKLKNPMFLSLTFPLAYGLDCQEMSQKPCQIMSMFCNHYYIWTCSAILMTSKSWDVVFNEKYGCWEF
jgi:hypothetical protein